LLTQNLTTFLAEHRGQTLTEMAFILAFIVLVVIVVIPLFGAQTTQLYNDVVNGFGG